MSKIITLDRLSGFLTNLKGLFVTKTDAESTYETKANATNIYETKTDAATHLTKIDAETTYATKTELTTAENNASNTYLSKTDAADTYVNKTDASNTYATKTEVSDTYLSKADAAFGQYLNSNGYKKLPGGLLIQWVTVTFNLPTTLSSYYVLSASFPIAFKSTPFFSSVSVGNCDSIEAGEFSAGLSDVSTTGANIRIIRLSGSDDSNTEVSRISILAFGTY